jgi:hypothetical protein
MAHYYSIMLHQTGKNQVLIANQLNLLTYYLVERALFQVRIKKL